MRQAGRYISEYRERREEYSFKGAIKDPEIAERITLLPWNRFEPDDLVMSKTVDDSASLGSSCRRFGLTTLSTS